MSLVELLAVAGTMASILGVFLAIHARYNNRLIKEESRHAREILNRSQEILKGHSEILNRSQEILKGHSEILLRIEQGQEETRKEVAEARKEMAETLRRMDETLRRMDEGHRESIKYLADLIRSEGEKTRQAIPGMSG